MKRPAIVAVATFSLVGLLAFTNGGTFWQTAVEWPLAQLVRVQSGSPEKIPENIRVFAGAGVDVEDWTLVLAELTNIEPSAIFVMEGVPLGQYDELELGGVPVYLPEQRESNPNPNLRFYRNINERATDAPKRVFIGESGVAFPSVVTNDREWGKIQHASALAVPDKSLDEFATAEHIDRSHFVDDISAAEVQKHVFALGDLSDQIQFGGSEGLVSEGDFIFVDPLTTVSDAPHQQPRQFMQMARRLSADEPQASGLSGWLWALIATMFTVLAWQVRQTTFMWANFAFGTTALFTGLWFAAGGDILFAWADVAIPTLLNAGIALGMNIYDRIEMRKRVLRSLEGLAAPEHLERFVSNLHRRSDVRTEAMTAVMTIAMREGDGNNEPPDVAKTRHAFLRRLMGVCHEHGGLVFSRNPQRIRVVFGYDMISNGPCPEELDKVFKCATTIQELTFEESKAAIKADVHFFPIRIGLHVAPLTIVHTITGKDPRFEVIGRGTPFVEKLVDRCEVFRMMLSDTARSRFMSDQTEKLSERTLQVEDDQLISAFEFDPFADEQRTIGEIILAHNKLTTRTRADFRWQVRDQVNARITAPSEAAGDLLDFSLSGFLLKLDHFFAKGTVITVCLTSGDGKLEGELETYDVTEIRVTVRWGNKANNGDSFLHGVEILELEDTKKDILLMNLRNYADQEQSKVS